MQKATIVFFSITFIILAFTCSTYAQCVATATNVTCTGAGNLSFDLTMTDAGSPVTIASSGGTQFSFSEGSSVIFSTSVSGGDVTNVNLSTTIPSGDCADVLGKSLAIASSDIPATCTAVNVSFPAPVVAPPAATVPTMGQWGLIILSLLMLSVGVVALRSERETSSEIV